MWDRRMIGEPNRAGKKTIEIYLPGEGESWTTASVAPRRQADIGYPAITYVTVISAVEATRINVDFRRRAEETLRANLAKKGEGVYLSIHRRGSCTVCYPGRRVVGGDQAGGLLLQLGNHGGV